MSAINDPKTVRRQYATNENLSTRQQIHEQYSVPKIDFTNWVLSTVAWRGDEYILDVGCGAGTYYPTLKHQWAGVKYHGLDLSPGMLERHPGYRTNPLITGDAQQLPFADHSFDVIMANHMLYHVQNIDSAITEFRRVLKPGGVLLTATNSQHNMPEIHVLMRRAIILLTRTPASQVVPPMPASDLFTLENGCSRLSHHFYAVMRHDLPSTLVFSEVEPVMAYLESARDTRAPQLPDDVHWDDVMGIMRQQVTHLINHMGELVINKLAGVLVATDRGDFVHQFVKIHDQVRA